MKTKKTLLARRQYIEKSPHIVQNTLFLAKLIAILLVAALLLALAIYSLSRHYLGLKTVDVVVYQQHKAAYHPPLDEVKIRKLLSQAMLGAHFLTWDATNLQQHLLDLAWVKAVDIQFVLPNHLHAALTPQTAVARYAVVASLTAHQRVQSSLLIPWVQGLLNEEGQLFSPAETRYPTNLALLAGSENKTQHLLRQYQLYQTLLLPHQLELLVLYYDPYHAWHLRLRPRNSTGKGVVLHLGGETNEQGLSRFVKLYQQVLKQRLDSVAAVDLRYSNGVAVAWDE